MAWNLYTFVCEYDGGTYVAQVCASDETAAITEWGGLHRCERPADAISDLIAQAAVDDPAEPTPLTGLTGVWCWTAIADERPMLVNIVRSA